MLMPTPSLPRSVVLLCLLAIHSIAIHAAEPPAGMVDEPCPAPSHLHRDCATNLPRYFLSHVRLLPKTSAGC